MPTTAAGVLQRGPRRSHQGDPAAPIRRGELAAALAGSMLIAGLLLVPAAGLIMAVLLAVGGVCRWPARWLLVPMLAGAIWLAGVIWLSAAGPGRALTVLAAGSGQLAVGLAHAAGDPSRLPGYPAMAATAVARGLSRGLPLALAVGAAQAWLVGWLSRAGADGGSRAGPLAAARRWHARALLSAGETVTSTGCAVGLHDRTGSLVHIGWADAGRGVLLTGTDPADVALPALAIACAALRLRKTILALGPGDGPARCAALAARLGVPVTWAGEPDGAAFGRAIRARSVLLATGPAPALLGEAVSVLGWLADRGLRSDCLLWLSGCEGTDPGQLAALLALGSPTGAAVLVSTASEACAEELARHASLTIACGPVSPQLAVRLAGAGAAAAGLAGQRRGTFSVIGPDGVRPGCRAVPATALTPAGAGLPGRGAPVTAGRR